MLKIISSIGLYRKAAVTNENLVCKVEIIYTRALIPEKSGMTLNYVCILNHRYLTLFVCTEAGTHLEP